LLKNQTGFDHIQNPGKTAGADFCRPGGFLVIWPALMLWIFPLMVTVCLFVWANGCDSRPRGENKHALNCHQVLFVLMFLNTHTWRRLGRNGKRTASRAGDLPGPGI